MNQMTFHMLRYLACLLAAGFVCDLSRAGSINILNGDFEDVTGLSMTTPEVFTGIPSGWSFSRLPGGTSDTIQILDYSFAESPQGGGGDFYLEGHQEFAAGTLFQSLTGFTQGMTYRLDFLWGNRGIVGKDEYDFTVRIGGEEFSRAGVGPLDMRLESIVFIATSNTHDLEIEFNDPGQGESDTMGAFDNFRVTAIPEPCGLVLLIASITALTIARHG